MRNKNSDIRVSSDLHLLAPAAVQILYLIQIKNNELSWDTFFPPRCPMEENEILFESNKKITTEHEGFLFTRYHTGKEEILFGSNKINLLAARSRETV